MAVTVDRWSGRYARALREAKRMSVREFATHLGVTDATVSNWERRRDQTRLRYETQQLLDTCLARSTPEQQARFERLLAASPDRPHGPPGDPHGGGADRGARVGGALPVAVESVAACDPTAALARVLTGHVPSVRPEVAPSLAALETAVTHAKRDYQAGRYGDALHPLPDVIRLAEVTTAGVDGDTRPQAFGLAASAYQVACSLLIKHGDVAVAMLAADECVAAALAGGDPVAVAASARAMTHALLASGHHHVAAEYGEAAAGRLDRAGGSGGPTGLSVRGALLLRAAHAAAQGGDRGWALTLLDEAESCAERLGADGNAYWTLFGPTNVSLHRVSVALSLGDAGRAIDHASRIDLDRVPRGERRACLLMDMARAFTQWGKYDRAYEALCAAVREAWQEVACRPVARDLVGELAQRSAAPVRHRVQQLAHRVGVIV